MVGQYKLHPQCYIVAAGNLSTDKAIVNNLSTAMLSRLVHIEMEANFMNWLEDVAIKYNYDERIIAYLNMYPNKLMDFNPEHNEKTFCCPRTWEFVNRIINKKSEIERLTKLISGTISDGVAVEFVQFSKIYKKLPSFEEIIKNPKKINIPEDLATKWAITTSIVEKTNQENLDKVFFYIDRYDESFQVMFYRMLLMKQPILIGNPVIQKVTRSLYKFMNEDG